MSSTRRLFGSFPVLLCMTLLSGVPPLQADEVENRERLRDMPLSRRNDLLKNLDRFRALPSAEQTTIRDFDRQLSEEDPAVRARHLALLRRYHAWLATLTDTQRKSLQSAGTDERIALINEYLKAEHKSSALTRNDSKIWTQLTSLSPVLLVDQAHWIRIWLKLTPKQREQLSKKGLGEAERLRLLEQFGRENGIDEPRPSVQGPDSESVLRTIQARPKLKKYFDQAKPATKRAMTGRIGERRYLMQNASAQVDSKHLDRFIAALPSWLLISVDSLPPDAASLRMRILYRMVFPEGTEMPVVETANAKPAKPAPPAPLPSKPGTITSF